MLVCFSSAGYSQTSFKEILSDQQNRTFGEIVELTDQYFQEKYPDLTAYDLSQGEHRDGEFVKYMRWRSFWKSRVKPDNSLYDLSNYQKIRQDAALQTRSNGLYDDLEWNNVSYDVDLGVQIGLGRTSSIGFHPTDPNTFYVGAAIGGIWKTTDGGQTYIPLGDELPYLAVSCIVVNQDNPDHLYIAISDRVWYGPPSIGVYKSTDGGETWSPTSLSFTFSNNVRIYWMEADPNDPNIMYVATSSGLFRTTDAFDTFETVNSGVVTDVKFRPGSSDVIYYVRRNPNRFYRSTDGGDSFEQLESFSGSGYLRLITTPLNPDKVYVSSDNKLHKSFNGGSNFTFTYDLTNAGVGDGIVMISPANEFVLFAGFFDMYRSEDDGLSFNQISHWLGQFQSAIDSC